jgi:3-oxoadipate enol-lactonase
MFAKILGTNIYYEATGDGPPLMFVHGLGGTGNVWHAQRQGLSRFFKVITLDLPGSGCSEKTEKNYGMGRWADQIIGLADHLQLACFTLIGHSMTTILAQNIAAKYVSRIEALVLCGPMTALSSAGVEAFKKRAETVLKEGMLAVADSVLGGALSPATREGNAVLAGLYRALLLANDPVAYAGHCQALIQASAREDQPRISCPTLIVLGDQDSVTPLSGARTIAAAIPKSTIRIIPATAHLTMGERPELFNAALIEFLAG